MRDLSFAERDRIQAAKERKVAQCIERMERTLLREFTAEELYFIWTTGLPPLHLL